MRKIFAYQDGKKDLTSGVGRGVQGWKLSPGAGP